MEGILEQNDEAVALHLANELFDRNQQPIQIESSSFISFSDDKARNGKCEPPAGIQDQGAADAVR